MSIIFKTEERRVIPRLRSFELAVSTGELSLTGKSVNKINFYDPKLFLDEQTQLWKKNKNLAYAGDILGSAFVLGVTNEFQDVARYVLDHSENEFDPLTKLAQKSTGGSGNDMVLENITSISEATRHDIRRLKHILTLEPRNPIAWMELGRLYALEGQLSKANRAVENALALDNNNRFIVRSASRFYHHFSNDAEKSLHIIRNAEYFKYDPWLLSADIAYSQVLNRFSKMIKVGEAYVKHHGNDNLSITELTSGLGTLELKNGHTKEAKKYFRQALIYPTDNSLAQVNWVAENITGFNVDTLKYELPLAFEAKAIYYYEKGDFNAAYEQSLKWQVDEPFSVRPIKAASYILGFFFKNYKASVELTRKGLKIDPDDVVLSNNMVYYLAQDGQLEEATQLFDKSLKNVVQNPEQYSNSEQMFCNATAGLIFYKQGLPELGKLYYSKAIDISKKIKNWYLTSLATVNYAKAALVSDISNEEAELLIKQLIETCRLSSEEDIKYMYNEILVSYNNRMEIGT